MRADGLDLPATSTDGSLVVPQVLGLAPTASGELVVSADATLVFTAQFVEPLRAEAILTYGNASQAGFPHPGHQLATDAVDELRPLRLERAEVGANLQRRDLQRTSINRAIAPARQAVPQGALVHTQVPRHTANAFALLEHENLRARKLPHRQFRHPGLPSTRNIPGSPTSRRGKVDVP